MSMNRGNSSMSRTASTMGQSQSEDTHYNTLSNVKDQLEVTLKRLASTTEQTTKKDKIIAYLSQRIVEKETMATLAEAQMIQKTSNFSAAISEHTATIASMQKKLDLANERSKSGQFLENLVFQLGWEVHIMFQLLPLEGREAVKMREKMKTAGPAVMIEHIRNIIRTQLLKAATKSSDSAAEIEHAMIEKAVLNERENLQKVHKTQVATLQGKVVSLQSELDAANHAITSLQNEIGALKKHQRTSMALLRSDIQEYKAEIRKLKAQNTVVRNNSPDRDEEIANRVNKEIQIKENFHKKDIHSLSIQRAGEVAMLKKQIESLEKGQVDIKMLESEISRLKTKLKDAHSEVVRSRIQEERSSRQKAETLLNIKDEQTQQLTKEVTRLQTKLQEESHTMFRIKNEYDSIFEAQLQHQAKLRILNAKRQQEKRDKTAGSNAEDVAFYKQKAETAHVEAQRAFKKIKKLVLHLHYERTRFEQFKHEASEKLRKAQVSFSFTSPDERLVPLSRLLELSDNDVDDEGTPHTHDASSPLSYDIEVNLDDHNPTITTPSAHNPTPRKSFSIKNFSEHHATPHDESTTTTPTPSATGSRRKITKRIPTSDTGATFNFQTLGKPFCDAFDMSLLSPAEIPKEPSVAGALRPQSAQSLRAESEASTLKQYKSTQRAKQKITRTTPVPKRSPLVNKSIDTIVDMTPGANFLPNEET